jgi:sporulation protein YlmC with PRC-barrel domain
MNRLYRGLLLASCVSAASAVGASGASAQSVFGNTLNSVNSMFNSNSTTTANTIATPVKNADGTLNASEVIGMSVVNHNDKAIGKIGELVLAQDGSVHGVVVDVGGFLGMGTHPVLLDWKQVSMVDKNGSTEATVNMSRNALKQLPEYTAK